MLTQTLRTLFARDLKKLRKEIEQYNNEQKIWAVEATIPNSAGTLCLHLVGNLNTYIGANLGNTGYIRHRELEFSLKDIPRQELLTKIDETISVVDTALSSVTDEQLAGTYPAIVFAEHTTTEYMLVHLATHLAYHLGQVNYHRRLLDK
jgi:uncharacterized damage-inducible protein DinB